MNIELQYLYRDGANNKKHGFVVFSNKNSLSIQMIEETVRSVLIESEWFVASKWHLPDLHFEDWDEGIDHNWHEFNCVAETEEVNAKEDVTAFLERIAT